MGVDARMIVRIRGEENWLTREDADRLAYELASSIGSDFFQIVWAGEFSFWPDGKRALEIIKPFTDEHGEYEDSNELHGKIVKHQDGDPIIANDGEQFINVNLSGRYWGPGYERGNWPIIKAVAEWLETRIPQGEVWYGGDSSGICLERFDMTKRAEFSLHWALNGRRPYVTFGGRVGSSVACPHCNAPLANCGGGQSYDFLWCDGCDRRASKHKDGRLVWADTKWHDYPSFNQQTGEPEQRKRHPSD